LSNIRIGLIGAGGAARAIHIPGFALYDGVEIAAVCDSNREAAAATGVPDVTSDIGNLLARDDIHAIINATPNYLHREVVLAAARAGKHILCEKPLALNVQDAREMLRAAEAAHIVHMTAFTYRYVPALSYMRHLVEQGRLGKLRTVRAAYLMALSGHLLGWRSVKAQAGSGVLADVGSHLMQMVELAAGPVDSLCASSRRFREDPASDVEDWIAFLADYRNGATGTVEIARVCPGRGAGITENIFIELYGSEGSAIFDLQDPWGLQLGTAAEAAKPPDRVAVPTEFLKIPNSPRDVNAHDPRWGYRYDQAFQFLESIRLNKTRPPSFADGVRCQAILDAALASAESRSWVKVDA
jgi:predicted dehydrogenase